MQLVNRLQPDPQPCGEWKNGLRPGRRQRAMWSRFPANTAAAAVSDYYLSSADAHRLHRCTAAPGCGTSWAAKSTAASAGAVPAEQRRGSNTVRRRGGSDPRYQQVQQQHPGTPAVPTLGLATTPAGQNPLPAAQQALRQWLQQRRLAMPELVLEKRLRPVAQGSISAASLAALLIWHRPARPVPSWKAACRWSRWTAP